MENEYSYWINRLKKALKELATDEIKLNMPAEKNEPPIAVFSLDEEEDIKKVISSVEDFSIMGIKEIYHQVTERLLWEKMNRVMKNLNGIIIPAYRITVDEENEVKGHSRSALFKNVIRKITDQGSKKVEIEDTERLS